MRPADVSNEVLSGAENRFDEIRRKAGLFLAPLVMLTLWFAPFTGLRPEAHHLLAVLGLVVTLWVTEAIPLPVTALLGPALCVLTGVGAARDVFESFADPVIFLFLGSFLLAEAMLHRGLNRRIAFHILGLKAVGESPGRLLLAFGGITAFLSMWISNTATTAMMLPIGLSILSEMARRQSERAGREIPLAELKFGTGLMLLAAFASSIGGLATPIGTPPNLITLGLLRKSLGVEIPFFHWMLLALPVTLLMLGFLIVYLKRVCPAEPGLLEESAKWIAGEKARLGALDRGERNVLLAFGTTVFLWVFPGFLALGWGTDLPLYQWLHRRVPEAMAALIGATLLFVLPVNARAGEFTLGWKEAKRIDWGTLLLFGGGLALGTLMFTTGLARWIGEGLAHAFHARTMIGLVVLFVGVGVLVTETTSNAASANMVVPVAIAVAQGAGVNPLQPALAACLGVSMCFLLPVSTPPNAIVYGSGCVPLLKMVKYGLLLELVGAIVVVAVVMWWVPLILR